MATNIVDSLFGPQPWQIQRAENAGLGKSADAYASQAPFERAAGQLYRAGGMFGQAGMEGAGYVNPAVAEAQTRDQQMAGVTPDAKSLRQRAMAIQDPRMKFQLEMLARQMESEEAKVKLDEAKTEREYALAERALRENPNLATATVGVKGRPGWKQLIIYDKTKPNDPYQEVGEPLESDKGTNVNVAAPVTPVTIQDPKNPDATLVIDGRTRQILGAGPKLTETGKMNVKKQSAMEGLSGDLKTAEDLLTGVATGSKPTSSGAGAAYDYAASLVGIAPEGSKEADELKVVAGRLVQKVPRFEGQQSDRDVQLYKESAADAGNSKIPISRRLAAVRRMKMLYEGYESGERGRIGAGGSAIKQKPSSAVDAALEKYK